MKNNESSIIREIIDDISGNDDNSMVDTSRTVYNDVNSKNNYHEMITDEMVDRIEQGENSSHVIDELCQRYSNELFDGNYDAYLFCKDALIKRAWVLRIIDKEKLFEDKHQLKENIYDDYLSGTNVLIVAHEDADDAVNLLIDNNIAYAIDNQNKDKFYFINEELKKAKEIFDENEISYKQEYSEDNMNSE